MRGHALAGRFEHHLSSSGGPVGAPVDVCSKICAVRFRILSQDGGWQNRTGSPAQGGTIASSG